jgi:hypothetical protein
VCDGVFDATGWTKAGGLGTKSKSASVGIHCTGKELDEEATVGRLRFVVESLKRRCMNLSWPISSGV